MVAATVAWPRTADLPNFPHPVSRSGTAVAHLHIARRACARFVVRGRDSTALAFNARGPGRGAGDNRPGTAGHNLVVSSRRWGNSGERLERARWRLPRGGPVKPGFRSWCWGWTRNLGLDLRER